MDKEKISELLSKENICKSIDCFKDLEPQLEQTLKVLNKLKHDSEYTGIQTMKQNFKVATSCMFIVLGLLHGDSEE